MVSGASNVTIKHLNVDDEGRLARPQPIRSASWLSRSSHWTSPQGTQPKAVGNRGCSVDNNHDGLSATAAASDRPPQSRARRYRRLRKLLSRSHTRRPYVGRSPIFWNCGEKRLRPLHAERT